MPLLILLTVLDPRPFVGIWYDIGMSHGDKKKFLLMIFECFVCVS